MDFDFDNIFGDFLDSLPGIIHVNVLSEGIPLVYLNSTGLSVLNITAEEFKNYDKTILNTLIVDSESSKNVGPLILKLISDLDSTKTLSFYQKIRPINSEKTLWFFTSCRIFQGKYLISFSNNISTIAYDRERVEQFLEERVLASNYNEKFNSLTKQEKAILSLIGKGYDSKSISTKLGNTPKTVNNIRNNIKQKLEMSGRLPSMTELVQFARIFNI